MPSFIAGSTHNAKVRLTNPKTVGFDYTAIISLDSVASAQATFHLNAGESKDILFAVTMPSVPQVYAVTLSVFSGVDLIAGYRATEDVTVTEGIAPGTATVKGWVTDLVTGSPIPNAIVQLGCRHSGEVSYETQTDSSGYYIFEGVTVADPESWGWGWRMRFRHPDYATTRPPSDEPEIFIIHLQPDQIREISITMPPLPEEFGDATSGYFLPDTWGWRVFFYPSYQEHPLPEGGEIPLPAIEQAAAAQLELYVDFVAGTATAESLSWGYPEWFLIRPDGSYSRGISAQWSSAVGGGQKLISPPGKQSTVGIAVSHDWEPFILGEYLVVARVSENETHAGTPLAQARMRFKIVPVGEYTKPGYGNLRVRVYCGDTVISGAAWMRILGQTVYTEAYGYCGVENIPAGCHECVVGAPGCKDYTFYANIEPDRWTDLRVSLEMEQTLLLSIITAGDIAHTGWHTVWAKGRGQVGVLVYPLGDRICVSADWTSADPCVTCRVLKVTKPDGNITEFQPSSSWNNGAQWGWVVFDQPGTYKGYFELKAGPSWSNMVVVDSVEVIIGVV